jgi:glycine cleavage system H lipoate-binding protein
MEFREFPRAPPWRAPGSDLASLLPMQRASALRGSPTDPTYEVNEMVALFVIGLILCALTTDYIVQRLALRMPTAREVSDALDGIFMDGGHLWIRPEAAGLARVGTDDVVGVLLGSPQRIDWPSKGPVKRGAPLAVVHGRGRSLTLRSPVDGEVVEQNTKFTTDIGKASTGALEARWMVRVKTADLLPHLAAMKTGAKLRDCWRQEMDRLRAFALSRLPAAAVGATAADGGPLAADLASRLDDEAWNEAVRLMLGNESLEQDAAADAQPASSGGRP